MMILVISSLVVTILPSKVGATVHYVGGSGPGNYTTIQTAVDATSAGDTVFVYSGTYSEHVVIHNTISLVGENRDTTVIDGNGGGSTLTIEADWVNVTGFTVTRRNVSYGSVAVDVGQTDNNTIAHNIIIDSYIGVNLGGLMLDSFYNKVTDNVLSGNFFGIYGYYTHWLALTNNTIVSSMRYGISLDDSSDGLIINNTISTGGISIWESPRMTVTGNVMGDEGITISGYALQHWNTHAIDTSNIVGGRPIYYWRGKAGGSVPLDAGQVILADSTGVAVENQHMSNVSVGIALGFSRGSIVENNVVSYSTDGIHLTFSDGNTVTNNTLSLNGDGIHLSADPGRECGTNKITNNTLFENGGGIYSYYTRHNVIIDNAISENIEGIHLTDSWNHTIANNTISSNTFGIKMMGWSQARVSANRIEQNGQGIVIEFYSTGFESTIYHNEFINNTEQANDDSDDFWDDGYPSGGNFWSDYTGVDYYSGPNQDEPGGDDIGDTPHPIPGGSNRDRYPLMRMGGPRLPLSPRNLSAVAGDGEVKLTWIPPASNGGSPITNYTVYRGTTPGGEAKLVELGNVLNYTDTGLNNGWTYYYQISAKNTVGEGPKSNEASATPMRPPGPPTGLKTVAGDGLVVLNWTAPLDQGGSPITNYTIYRGTSSGGESYLNTTGNVTDYTDSGLTNGVTYYYQVAAKNVKGEGPRSNEANATPMTMPGPPTGLTAMGGDRQISLNWTPPLDYGGSPITNYTIYRGTSPGGESYLNTTGNVTDYVDSDVTVGVTYYYVVAAVNAVGEGPNSTEANATPGGPPTRPLNLGASAGNRQVILTWAAPASDGGYPITNYAIYRGTSSGGGMLLIEIGNVLTYTDTGLTNGQTYFYQVAAKNAAGPGPRSDEVNATPMTTPGPPAGLTTTAGDKETSLSWVAPMDDGGSPVTNYRIYRGDTPGGEAFLVEIGNVLSYTDTGLMNGQAYYYQVAAVNAVGEGSKSNEDGAIPAGLPGSPTGLGASSGDSYVLLTWSQPVNTGGLPILHYRISRGTAPGAETFIAEIGSTPTHNDTGLLNGQGYYYTVSAVNAVGEGPQSGEATATPGKVPSEPLQLKAVASKGQVVLSWQPPAEDGGFPVTSYKIYRGTASGAETYLASVSDVLAHSDKTVTNGNTFFYWVTALNSLGEGQRSLEVNGTPMDIPPACVISTPRLGSTVSGTVVVSGLASDSDGFVQWVEVRIDQEQWITAVGNTSWSYSWDTTKFSDGEHTIFARSNDGNSDSPETSINVTVRNHIEEDTRTLPFVALGLGVGGGTVTMIWLLEPLRVALIGFLAFLGTKLRRDEVFENEKRDMIRGYLTANPGANYASIRADLKIANGTLVYHLNTMEKEGFIRSWHDGRFKRFALKDHPIADIQPRLTDIELIVLQALQGNPGMTQEAIAKEVGVSQPTISYHMKKLSELGFVSATKQGMRRHYTAVIESSRLQKEAAAGEGQEAKRDEGGGTGVNGGSS